MTGFEQRTSCVKSDHSANWATTTGPIFSSCLGLSNCCDHIDRSTSFHWSEIYGSIKRVDSRSSQFIDRSIGPNGSKPKIDDFQQKMKYYDEPWNDNAFGLKCKDQITY